MNNLGPHGLPLIGRADWNDCLNLNCFSTDPNESFQTATSRDGRTAESSLIAGMFVLIGQDFVEICRRTGRDADDAGAAEAQIQRMRRTVVEHAWDGEWFLRAYDDRGDKVGSRECEDGRIFIESNAFCAMAEIGSESGYPLRALDSVRKHLDTKYGIVIHDPPYRGYHVELGEVSSYPPGYKENGGVFCHNNPWIMIAECIAGRPDRAFEYYRKISPAYLDDIQELHRMEPYVYSQMIAGKAAPRQGEAKNSWLTGTAAWNFIAVTQWILGVRAGVRRPSHRAVPAPAHPHGGDHAGLPGLPVLHRRQQRRQARGGPNAARGRQAVPRERRAARGTRGAPGKSLSMREHDMIRTGGAERSDGPCRIA